MFNLIFQAMRKFILLSFYCIIPFLGINAQKISINKIDKFTKKRVVETSFERISNSNPTNLNILTKRVWIAFGKYDDTEYLRLKWCTISVLSINKDAEIIFLDNEGNTYTFKNAEYQISESGKGTAGAFGTGLQGLDIFAYGDISSLEGKNITDMRIYTTDGIVDFEINKKASNKISETYQVYKNTISKE